MPGGSYERYGLNGNPFRDLASETLEDVEIGHVQLGIDDGLRSIKDEVLDKENKAVVAVVGPLGAGKTERLLLAASEGRQQKAFVVYFDIPERATWVLRGLSEGFLKSAKERGLGGLFSTPGWLREMAALRKATDEKYNPLKAGRTVAEALNSTAPSFLLLNDLHNLTRQAEVDAFAKVLQEVADTIRPGVLVMFGAYPNYMPWIGRNRPGLAARINRTVLLPALANDQAGLLIAKKLLAKRVVEDLEPLFPFDKASVAALNVAASGNPRRILQLADAALDSAVNLRSPRVDAVIVEAALRERAKTLQSLAPRRPQEAPAASPPTTPRSPAGPPRTVGTGAPPQR